MKSFVVGLAALSSIASVQAQLGIAYSPYHTDMTCKSQDEVNADFDIIYQSGSYATIRTYGTDCDQVNLVLTAIRDHGSQSKLFAGIYDITQTQSEAQTIIDTANGDWSLFDTVSVGNEGINDGTYTQDALASAVSNVKSQLSGAGYGGPVVTVDVFVQYLNNPSLCSIGDYVAANCHPYFDGGVTFDQAGSFVTTQHQNVVNACGGARVVITESGWPSQGNTNGQAVPSPSNQQGAISSLRSAFSSDLFLFESFNDYWKQPGSDNVEQYWGFLGDSASTPPPSRKRSSRVKRSKTL